MATDYFSRYFGTGSRQRGQEGMAQAQDTPAQGPGYSGFDPKTYFGDFGKKGNFPSWMKDFALPGKYAMGPVNQFQQDIEPLIGHFRKEAGSDIYGSLMERSRRQVETQGREVGRMQKESLSRAGYGAGGGSPMDAFLTQTRMMAGAGQLGLASQTAELMARQYRNEATTNLHNLLSSRLQAQMIPAHLQASRTAQVPISGGGPGFFSGAGSFLSGLSGFA